MACSVNEMFSAFCKEPIRSPRKDRNIDV